MKSQETLYRLKNKVRFVTAASLFDGHDASINIIRRLLQARGAEVIHLGHNRSVSEIVSAAIQEDAQAIAVSSYQGGHNEFFRYLVDLLRERGASHVRVFGGGGGVIVPREIRELEQYGVTRIYSPEDGRVLGLAGMIDDMLRSADFPLAPLEGRVEVSLRDRAASGKLARLLTQAEMNGASLARRPGEKERRTPVVGITGTGGAGKSSLTDEIVRRFVTDAPELPIAILSVDPTKRKTGGALLGDRIRMNAIERENVYMRSFATRGSGSELPKAIETAIEILSGAGFRLVLVETSGIGQGSSAVADISDLSLYVMTPEYGAPSQLEKIDMLDFADVVAINKFDRRGGEDALRDVRKQFRRGKHIGHEVPDSELPIFGTIASQFGDRGVDALYLHLLERLREIDASFPAFPHSGAAAARGEKVGRRKAIIPDSRERYLGEITELLRKERERIESEVSIARKLYQLEGAASQIGEIEDGASKAMLRERSRELRKDIRGESLALIEEWPELKKRYSASEVKFEVRGREIAVESTTTTLSGSRVPKVALPRFEDWGEILRFRLQENLPGYYPFTAGVFPFKRDEESPRRQFAGEGGPSRTNQRFHYLSRNDAAKRLSTAFDSVTLYGEDPGERPDIFGKIGEGGVSVATLDDMKDLYAGFDLLDPSTSVSMTINGPAPAILAMFFNTAIDREVERFERERGRKPDAEGEERIRRETLSTVRGTVQADILKEDQAQNTCIFSTDFALRLMGDVQQFFIDHSVRNFYSVSVSGYHIAEAGANPITQLAFTLANGFTYVEYYLARGMPIDDFAPNLSFFFSNGLDPEYSVLGRVARRIWARVMRNRYGAGERSQKFKYHIQTSGRSLHAREIQFNDIRTTLQALTAIYDHCNSLHTNAYNEAITTPTTESVRRAMAIQQIIQKEFGVAQNQNPLQGSYVIDDLTDRVEEAVLAEFDRLNSRGGVLGAIELQYQRSRIQEESLNYELKKDSGELPVVGVNSFLDPEEEGEGPAEPREIELARATGEEKQAQIRRLAAFQEKHRDEAAPALSRLREVALTEGGNVFAELMRTVRVASLGQVTNALYEVGGRYRRAL
jgi:methylmalonyl-CoA mutase